LLVSGWMLEAVHHRGTEDTEGVFLFQLAGSSRQLKRILVEGLWREQNLLQRHGRQVCSRERNAAGRLYFPNRYLTTGERKS